MAGMLRHQMFTADNNDDEVFKKNNNKKYVNEHNNDAGADRNGIEWMFVYIIAILLNKLPIAHCSLLIAWAHDDKIAGVVCFLVVAVVVLLELRVKKNCIQLFHRYGIVFHGDAVHIDALAPASS